MPENNQHNDISSVVTMGCRLNAFESAAIQAQLDKLQLAKKYIVVNSCAVTAEAERQTRQTIRRLRQDNPEKLVVVTGCASQISPEKFSSMAEVNYIVDNEKKLQLEAWQGLAPLQDNEVANVSGAAPVIASMLGRVRAHLPVQTGCDHSCTFCIIPKGRGKSRSMPAGQIVAQAKAFAAGGAQEVVITGVDITSYGLDLPGKPTLGQLLARLVKLVPEVPMWRLSSIDGAEVDDQLFELITQHPKIAPYVHLSLQSGDDMILKRMKRRHNRDEAIDLCQRFVAARPELILGADFITGFPTETEAMFQATCDTVQQCAISHLHVFPFSARNGTAAARIPKQIEKAERKARAQRLRSIGFDILQRKLLENINKELPILHEGNGVGRSHNYLKIKWEKPPQHAGWYKAKPNSLDGDSLQVSG